MLQNIVIYIQAKHIRDGNLKEIFYSGLSFHFMSEPLGNFLDIFKTLFCKSHKMKTKA